MKENIVWSPVSFSLKAKRALRNYCSLVLTLKHCLSPKIFFKKNDHLIDHKKVEADIVEQQEIENISTLETNNAALAVVKQKNNSAPEIGKEEVVLALDTIRDPGNLGTIIRLADWYGIKNIVAAYSTVELYNPKFIAALKGSFTRVNVFYTDLYKYLAEIKLPVLGTFLEGENVHTLTFPQSGILLMGNESKGIDDALAAHVTQKITIPRFGHAESLNVSIATAIILDNWKRTN
jgi:RNA methyltransferase, TrmH family